MDTPVSPVGKPSKHHFVPITITVVSLLLIVLIGVYTALTYRQKPQDTPQDIANQQNEQAYSFPRITVDSWKVEDSARFTPSATQATIYPLETSYGRADFNGLLFNFFTATSQKESGKGFRAYNDQGGSSMFYLQKDTGSFLYKSDSGIPIASAAGVLDESRRVVAFAQNVVRDDTVAQFATYEKRSNPGVVYYELHRDWNRLGFPLLNLFGVLNLKETGLRELSLLTSTNQIAPDADIIRTSDKTDGRKRPNDFNTVTVGVKDGRVVDVISNLRLFPRVATRQAGNKLITYNDAVKKLTSNGYSRLYTSPAGEGAVDREKMYPQNKANLREAVVTEATLAYLEELPGAAQDKLAPYYVFRGNGELSTGFRVNFVATVSATEQSVLGTSTVAQFNTTQQQGTFEIEEQPVATASPEPQGQQQTPRETNPPQNPPQIPPVSGICDENPQSVNQLYNVQTDETSGITFGQYDLPAPGNIPSTIGWYGPQWYAVTTSNHDINMLNKVIDTAVNRFNLKRDTTGNMSGGTTVRDFDSLLVEWEQANISCPLRLTGRSPSVFVYTASPAAVTIKLTDSVTYSDPPAVNNTWNVRTPTSYLYYEYAPVSFTTQTEGWNIKKSDLAGFAKKTGKELGLNAQETSRLVFELGHAALDVASEELRITLIPQSEVETKLPLAVSPPPDALYRIHFALTESSARQVPTPSLSPIIRRGYTVVELGATAN